MPVYTAYNKVPFHNRVETVYIRRKEVRGLMLFTPTQLGSQCRLLPVSGVI